MLRDVGCPKCGLFFNYPSGRDVRNMSPDDVVTLCPCCSSLAAAEKKKEHEVPLNESPAYYRTMVLDRTNQRRVEIDAGDLVDALRLNYWLGSAFVHIWRAGSKTGEGKKEAIQNALMCLRRELQCLGRDQQTQGE